MPVYRWMPPEDIAPLDRLLDAGRRAAAWTRVTFTSAPAAASPAARAEERGLLRRAAAALRHDVLAACVGPVTALPLQAQGVRHRAAASASGSARSSSWLRRDCPAGPARCRSPGTGWRSAATPCWWTGAAAGAAGRDVPAAGAGPAARAGWSRAPSCCGRCPARARRARRGDGDGPAADGAGRPKLIQTVVKRGYRLALDPAAGPVPVGGQCLHGDAL